MSDTRARTGKPQPLRDALRLGTTAFLFAGVFSLASNLLYLALPIFTNQVYGRVLHSQSGSTLLVLTIAALFVFIVSNVIDYFKLQVLSGFSVIFDAPRACRTFAGRLVAVGPRRGGAHALGLRDLDAVRQTIGGAGIGVLFDLPWIPVFLVILFIVDPWIGTVTSVGGLILLALAFAQDRATHDTLKKANEAAILSYQFTDAALRNAEVVRALGMLPTLGARWAGYRHGSLDATSEAGAKGGAYAAAIRAVRMIIQILIISVGALLAITGRIPSGILFANMLLAARALAPLERVVGSWNGLMSAHQAYKRLEVLLNGYEPPVPATQLPMPTGHVRFENVSFAPANATALVLANLTFVIEPGEMIGIVGHSGAGKSTLARLLVGIWKPNSGTVRLDGADVYSWERGDFGRHVAYQPQETELFSGTVRANICRFQPDASDADVVEAAKAAGAHELILRLPQAYETELGERATVLSAGQRQRVGLARTLFGNPKLVVMDEPNANLDGEGEQALMQAILGLKKRGATIVLVSHKRSAFAFADKILMLQRGVIAKYGTVEEVLGAAKTVTVPRPVLTEVRS